MKIPLSKLEYEALRKVSEKEGLTVDQGAQLAVLRFFKKYKPSLFERAKKHADPEILQVLEKS